MTSLFEKSKRKTYTYCYKMDEFFNKEMENSLIFYFSLFDITFKTDML